MAKQGTQHKSEKLNLIKRRTLVNVCFKSANYFNETCKLFSLIIAKQFIPSEMHLSCTLHLMMHTTFCVMQTAVMCYSDLLFLSFFSYILQLYNINFYNS